MDRAHESHLKKINSSYFPELQIKHNVTASTLLAMDYAVLCPHISIVMWGHTKYVKQCIRLVEKGY